MLKGKKNKRMCWKKKKSWDVDKASYDAFYTCTPSSKRSFYILFLEFESKMGLLLVKFIKYLKIYIFYQILYFFIY